jgi:hypothetical protein
MLLTDGNDPEQVFRYIAQYIVYSRQSGLNVSIEQIPVSGVFELHGPVSHPRLIETLRRLDNQVWLGAVYDGHKLPSVEYIAGMPPMSVVSSEDGVQIFRLQGEKFILSFRQDGAKFLENLRASLGGSYALDILRMESGEPRTGIDIPPTSTTPVRGSLSHLVDQRKVREKILFGHERISKELLRGVNHRRVGIVASRYVYGGCRILSSPHRFVIGELTSCTWSPILKKRICQGYIKPEFAVSQTPILVNVPDEIPDNVDKKFARRIVKQGPMQNVFRHLVPAIVVELPFENTYISGVYDEIIADQVHREHDHLDANEYN